MGGSNPPVCAPTPTLAERKRIRRLAAREYAKRAVEVMLENRHVTALEALASGRPLHGEAHFNRLRARFDEMVRQGLRRVPGAWTMQAESQ